MDDRVKKSLDLVADVTKQLVTLNGAIVTFVATIFRGELHIENRIWPIGLATAAVVAGLVTLFFLTGTVADVDNIQESEISVWHPKIRYPAILQLACFVTALITLVIVV